MTRLDEMLRLGLIQRSRKYRKVQVMPEPGTGLEILQRLYPCAYFWWLKRREDRARIFYRFSCATSSGVMPFYGCVEQLNKHLFPKPDETTWMEMLQRQYPYAYQIFLKEHLAAADLECCFSSEEVELTPEEFDDYLTRTGRKALKKDSERRCPECLTYGHIHSRTCSLA